MYKVYYNNFTTLSSFSCSCSSQVANDQWFWAAAEYQRACPGSRPFREWGMCLDSLGWRGLLSPGLVFLTSPSLSLLFESAPLLSSRPLLASGQTHTSHIPNLRITKTLSNIKHLLSKPSNLNNKTIKKGLQMYWWSIYYIWTEFLSNSLKHTYGVIIKDNFKKVPYQ